jgi:hypothetical protein
MIPARISNFSEAVSDTLLVELSDNSSSSLNHCSLAQDLRAASVHPRRRPCTAKDVRYPMDPSCAAWRTPLTGAIVIPWWSTSTYLLGFQFLSASVETALVQDPSTLTLQIDEQDVLSEDI